jgi:hypothetical protein
MRPAIVLVAVALAAPLAAAARPFPGITSSSIAGIRLGLTRPQTAARMTAPVRLDRLEDGYLRLASTRERVESYFRTGTRGVAVVATWSRLLKTAEQIGPCSTVAALRRAYSSRLVAFRQGGRVVAYRLGRLIFTVEGGKKVGVVGLGLGRQAVYVALNSTECS